MMTAAVSSNRRDTGVFTELNHGGEGVRGALEPRPGMASLLQGGGIRIREDHLTMHPAIPHQKVRLPDDTGSR